MHVYIWIELTYGDEYILNEVSTYKYIISVLLHMYTNSNLIVNNCFQQ